MTEQPEEPIRRARPRPRPTAAPVPDEPAPPIRLGIAGASSRPAPVAAAEPGPRPRPAPPTGIAGASSISDTDEDIAEQKRHADLSRFLASEPRAADDADVAKPQVRKRFGGRWWRIAIRVAIVIVIAGTAAFLLRTFVVAPYYIPSASMEPTLHGCSGCTKDHVLVDKLSYRSHDPHQGDIVVFHRPADAVGLGVSDKVLIKRVIGQEGDHVLIKNGHVYLNGATVPIDEPYVNKSCGPRPTLPLTETSSWTVPDNDVFVMGDNRCDSTDSRVFGPIPKSSIIGRAFAIVWPISRMRLLDGG